MPIVHAVFKASRPATVLYYKHIDNFKSKQGMNQASLAKWASLAKRAGLTHINSPPQVWFYSRNEQLQTDIKCVLSIQAIHGPLLFLKNSLQWCKSLWYSALSLEQITERSAEWPYCTELENPWIFWVSFFRSLKFSLIYLFLESPWILIGEHFQTIKKLCQIQVWSEQNKIGIEDDTDCTWLNHLCLCRLFCHAFQSNHYGS